MLYYKYNSMQGLVMKKFIITLFNIHNRYFPAIILIAIFSMFSYVNMASLINSVKNDGQIINQSGKQRMLSQHLVVLGYNYLSSKSDEDRLLLEQNIEFMKNLHLSLVRLEKSKTIESFYEHFDVSAKVDLFLGEFRYFLVDPSNAKLYSLSTQAKELVPILSDLVMEYENFNHEKIAYLRNRQLFILMVTFFILFLELTLVFYPTSRKIKEHTRELEQRVREEVEKNRQKDWQLSQQTRLAQMGEMIDMIAHQWHQPINAISQLNTQLELEAVFGSATKESTLAKTAQISSIISYLSDTIKDFREFFKPTKEKNFVDSSEIIQSVLNITKNSLKVHNIEIRQNYISHANLFTYANELKQVLLSIISNALAILMEREIQGAYVEIKTYIQGPYFIFELSDNGGGIDESIITKIFDANFTTRESNGGSGLGLYIGKTIIEEHCGGKLNVKNSDVGALFKIQIPIKTLSPSKNQSNQ